MRLAGVALRCIVFRHDLRSSAGCAIESRGARRSPLAALDDRVDAGDDGLA